MKKINNININLLKNKSFKLMIGLLLVTSINNHDIQSKEETKSNRVIMLIDEILEPSNNIVNINGKDMDKEALWNEYDNMAYFYEPLTEEEINVQYDSLTEYIISINSYNQILFNQNRFLELFDIYGYPNYGYYSDVSWSLYVSLTRPLFNKLIEDQPIMLDYLNYFESSQFTGYEFSCNQCYNEMGLGYYQNGLYPEINMQDKEVFIRYYKFHLSFMKKIIKDLNFEDYMKPYNPESEIKEKQKSI